MGLDITFKRVREHRCPDCGRLVFSECVNSDCSGGRAWYDFLEHVGYYVPHEKRPADYEDKWYAKDMILTGEQITYLLKNFPHEAYNSVAIVALVAQAITYNQSVVINADW